MPPRLQFSGGRISDALQPRVLRSRTPQRLLLHSTLLIMRSSFPALALLALLFATGCENIQTPGELTLQTRGALDVLPSNVQTVGMINLDEARTSEAVALATGERFSIMGMNGEHAARFQDFIAATGFDPDEDLHRVYFGVQGGPGPDRMPFFVVYADYDRARLDAYVNDQADLDFERSTYADAPVYASAHDGEEMAFALVNDDMIVASSQAGVFEMLDRIESGSAGLSGNARMMDLVRRADYPDDMWVAVRDLPASDDVADQDNPMGQASRMLDDLVLSVGFEDDGLGVNAFGTTRDGASSSDVADLVRGSVSVMKLQIESEDSLFDVLDRVQVDDMDDGVEVKAFLNAEALRTMRAMGDA